MTLARAPARPLNRWSIVVLAAALVIGAGLHFWQLTTKSLFLDEGFSIFLGGTPLDGFLSRVAHNDVHPPLFYLFAHAAISTLHWPREDYRWLTAPMGLVTILATWALARRTFGDAVAAFAALAVATAPLLVEFDRLFRMYAPLAALTTASWWVLAVAIEEEGAKRRAAWIVYGLLAISLPYVQYLGWFVVASQLIYAATRIRNAWPAFVVAALAVAAFIPWIWALRVQFPQGGLVGRMAGERFFWPSVGIYLLSGGGIPQVSLQAPPEFYYFTTAAVATLLVAGAVIARKTLLPYWLLPIALQVAITAASSKNLSIPRYFVHLVPAVACAIAVVIVALLRTRARLAGVVVAASVLAVSVVSLSNLLLVPKYQTSDWYAVDLLLLSRERQSDILVFSQAMPFLIMRAYVSVRGHRAYAASLPKDVAGAIAYLDRWPDRRVWYVENQSDVVDPRRRILQHLRATRPILGAWLQTHIEHESTVYIALFGPERRARRRSGAVSLPVGSAKSVVVTTSK